MSKIEWTEKVWNPVVGCSKVSPGCANCYAVNMAHRHSSNPNLSGDYHGLTVKHPNGQIDWSGKVRCLDHRLELPLRRKKPTMFFVNSMSDLFHEDVPDEFILDVWDTMNECRQHTFQILTKRPRRALEFSAWFQNLDIERKQAREWAGRAASVALPNVWLGVSVENQQTADERIPLLLQTPAAVRFLSCEPLLGPVDLREYVPTMRNEGYVCVDWVICGGESGPKARPMHPDWARGLRDQCQAANVPFFMKQFCDGGKKIPFEKWDDEFKVQEYPHASR